MLNRIVYTILTLSLLCCKYLVQCHFVLKLCLSTNFVILGHEADFSKQYDGHLLNVSYDFYSIMHYKTNQFSKDPYNLKTIHILDPSVKEDEVGQRKYLSQKDKERIKTLYNCRKYLILFYFTRAEGSTIVIALHRSTALRAFIVLSVFSADTSCPVCKQPPWTGDRKFID